MPGTTTKYGLTTLLGTDLARDIDTHVTSLANSVDAAMVGYSQGLLSARPVSTGGSPGKTGRRYRATDTGQEFIDHGTGWVEIAQQGSRGKSIIATEEARTNVAYGLLTTPDRVQGVVLPVDALIVVSYQAMWKQSVDGAARAAIFIGANQQKVAGPAVPVTQAAATGTTGGTNIYSPLFTIPVGLGGTNSGASYTGDVTTGQAVGWSAVSVGSYKVIYESNGTVITNAEGFGGGECVIFAAAGTYDISVQFKATSGTVTAKNRNLRVRVIPAA